jgi:CTD small phosphatase-like protein 2
LDQLDNDRHIKHRLYRQHSTQKGNYFIKDLSKLGRDLSRVIIIDNVAENFQLQPNNGIFIKSWFDDPDDTALNELLPILIQIAKKSVNDIRTALKDLKDQMIKEILKGNPNPHLSLNL